MEILGIGPSELIFIVIIALIVLGPRDMQKAGRSLGKWLRRIVTSDGWKLFQQTSREIQTLPNRLMREAALDELREVQKDLRQPIESASSSADSSRIATGGPVATPERNPVPEREQTIAPPAQPTDTPSSHEDPKS